MLTATFAAPRYVPTRFLETYSEVLRPYQTREDPFSLAWGGFGTGGSGAGHGSGGLGVRGGSVSAPTARQKFEGTPIFIGDAAIDAKGNATVRGTMPDNLTTFRVTAIASADGPSGPGLARFGHGDARVRVTAPLVVRAVTPRILRPGDRAELAAMLQNLGGPDGEAELSLSIVRGKQHVELVEPPALGVSMVAGGQAKLPFVLQAKSAGEVELELRASLAAGEGAPKLQDAVRATFEIAEPKELRQFAAAYGSIEDDGAFAVALARPRDLGRSGLDVDVELAGTMLAGLEPMARDLATYPYGCVEQTSSGLLPLVALRGLSHQGFLDIDVDEHVAAGIARLRAMQVGGGGLGYWPGASHVHVWGTAYALWVLEQLRAEGHAVPESLTEGMRNDLRARIGVELAQPTEGTTPAAVWDRLGVDPVVAAMTAQALVAAGDRPVALVAALHEHRAELPIFAKALLLMASHALEPGSAAGKTLLAELREVVDVREGTATVRPGPTYYDEYFDTSARTDAMVLLALLMAAPDDDIIEPLARGLGELRGAGRLANTQERAYALLSLSRYARSRETVVPAMTAAAWIGERGGHEISLVGRTPKPGHERQHIAVPGAGEAPRVTLQRKGKGRMYWRVGMSWTPRDAGRSADAHGIAIARELRTADARDVSRVTAGELVALDVTITVDRTQRYVAIELPLPPGLEAVDEGLGAGARARVLAARGGGWVSHRELWRDRALLFADSLSPGEHVATVFLRATTPGSFRMPAAVVHAMYAPERRGHTAHASVEVVHAKHGKHGKP
ncbi:MAG: alpha-2-macroglobulin family protein [Nannocystaceae bacterium]